MTSGDEIGRIALAAAGLCAVTVVATVPDHRLGAEIGLGVLAFGVSGAALVYWAKQFLAGKPPVKQPKKMGASLLRMLALSGFKLLWLGAVSWVAIGHLDVRPVPFVGGALLALFAVTAALLLGCRFLYRGRAF